MRCYRGIISGGMNMMRNMRMGSCRKWPCWVRLVKSRKAAYTPSQFFSEAFVWVWGFWNARLFSLRGASVSRRCCIIVLGKLLYGYRRFSTASIEDYIDIGLDIGIAFGLYCGRLLSTLVYEWTFGVGRISTSDWHRHHGFLSSYRRRHKWRALTLWENHSWVL